MNRRLGRSAPAGRTRSRRAPFPPALVAFARPAHAGLFDDDEARRAILDLRTQLDQSQQAHARQAERRQDRPTASASSRAASST